MINHLWLQQKKEKTKKDSLSDDSSLVSEFDSPLSSETDSVKSPICSICCQNTDHNPLGSTLVGINCGHKFCRSCWDLYLTMKINEGNVTDIVCPGLNCYAIVSPDVIGQLVSSETAKRFFHFDIRAFVDQNPNIRWCPSPGCGMAVKNPRTFNKKVLIYISINIQLTNPNSLNAQSTPIIYILNDINILSPLTTWQVIELTLLYLLWYLCHYLYAPLVLHLLICSITSWHQQCHLGF